MKKSIRILVAVAAVASALAATQVAAKSTGPDLTCVSGKCSTINAVPTTAGERVAYGLGVGVIYQVR